MDDTLPQYRQLYEILKDQIQKGVFQPGDLLPSESALCKTYNITRPTIRKALNNLVYEGYIKKQQGKGSIVQKRKAGIGILNIVGTTDSLPAGKLETKVIDPPKIMPWADSSEFEITQEELQAGCIALSRVRYIDGQAIFYEKTRLPNINLPNFTRRNFENKSLFGILSKYYNVKITGGAQKIWAIPAEGEICRLLDLEAGMPVLHLQKRYETSRPYFHFYSMLWCKTQEYYLEGAL